MLGTFVLPLVLLGVEPPPSAPVPEYRFTLDGSTTELILGQRGTLQISIEPRADKKLNLKSPFQIKLQAEGARLEKERLVAADAVAQPSQVSLQTSFEGEREGPATIRVWARFYICDDRICERRTETRTLAVTVSAPAGGR